MYFPTLLANCFYIGSIYALIYLILINLKQNQLLKMSLMLTNVAFIWYDTVKTNAIVKYYKSKITHLINTFKM